MGRRDVRRAVGDTGVTGFDEIELRVFEVRAVREDGVGTEEFEVIVDARVRFREWEQSCTPRSGSEDGGEDGTDLWYK